MVTNTMNGIDFNQLVTEKFDDLTKSEKRIANFLRRNQDESSFLSAAEVANRLDLSEATIVRFARSLGYSSYPAMRSHLQQHFRERLSHSSRLRSRLNDLRESGDIFERLTITEIDFLTQALESIDKTQMTKAVDLLRQHERIYVYGLGPSVSLVDLMEIRLRRFGKDVVSLKSSGRELLEPLLSMKPADLLFVICFFDQNPSLRLLLDYAHEVGATIIMLTDTLDTSLGNKAHVVLSAQRGPVGEFHSLVVPMTVINALLLSVAGGDQEKIMPMLDKLDLLRDQLQSWNKNSDSI
jgi:DNA-binding MurR/RpiR family transcriptional regulator